MEVLTLEEAISTYKAEAEQKRLDAALLYDARRFEESKDCIWKAEEKRQLVEWLKALKEIWDSGDCNDCLHQNNCIMRPQLGQLVRFNCYQYERR